MECESLSITYGKFYIFIILIRLITASVMILTMKLGFALLEVGSVRAKNISNIMLKNVVDTVIGAVVYFIVGFALQQD
jgi:ammonium transporter, Amt family